MHWAQRLDGSVANYLHGLVDQLPAPMLYGLVGLALVGLLIFGRLLANSFATKAPPIFEGIPFIGGILKFAKVPAPAHLLTVSPLVHAHWRLGRSAFLADCQHRVQPQRTRPRCAEQLALQLARDRECPIITGLTMASLQLPHCVEWSDVQHYDITVSMPGIKLVTRATSLAGV